MTWLNLDEAKRIREIHRSEHAAIENRIIELSDAIDAAYGARDRASRKINALDAAIRMFTGDES